MFSARAARRSKASIERQRFALYVEGPRDRDILRLFASKLSPKLARTMDPCIQILGGRQPRRAAALFRDLSERSSHEQDPRGLCILDRDDPRTLRDDLPDEPRLDFVVWNRRHIESYLLVPTAIRACLDGALAGATLERFIDDQLPNPDDETVLQEFDAKRLLAPRGPIASLLGTPLRPREIVRSMARTDVHSDVCDVLERVKDGLEAETA